MTTKITAAFADFSDVPPEELDNAVCRSCPVGMGCYDPHFCDVEHFTNLRYALVCGCGSRPATAYPYDWLEEKAVLCKNNHCLMLLGPARDRQRRMKSLNRTEIVERLCSVREKLQVGLPIIELNFLPFSGTMYRLCQALGLCEAEIIQSIGLDALRDLREYEQKSQPHPSCLMRSEIVEHLKTMREGIEQEIRLSKLNTSFVCAMYDICCALKLNDEDIAEALGPTAMGDFAGYMGLRVKTVPGKMQKGVTRSNTV